ncbi:MAG: hypothetical protein LBK98_10270 [Peptococcaceae bacterium]|nr:hypothetical protein [Peptococcaceae bacterium]
MSARVLGFCGTAKNTGKTTAMKAVMDAAYAKKLTVALTSIGFDGELADHVTGLPKPRIHALPGTVAAVAERCAAESGAGIEILRRTDIETALGKVVIGKVRKAGLLLLAGPTKSADIRRVRLMLEEMGCDLILVDGALNRVAPMVEADGIVLATGASRERDIALLARETAGIGVVYDLPVWEGGPAALAAGERDGRIIRAGSILDEEMALALLGRLTDRTEAVFLEGIIGEKGFAALLDKGLERLRGRRLIMLDPIKMLVSGSPGNPRRYLERLAAGGVQLLVSRQVPLRLITVNPFYPLYRVATHDYEAAYVDKAELRRAVAAAVKAPVINVLEESEEEIFAWALPEWPNTGQAGA